MMRLRIVNPGRLPKSEAIALWQVPNECLAYVHDWGDYLPTYGRLAVPVFGRRDILFLDTLSCWSGFYESALEVEHIRAIKAIVIPRGWRFVLSNNDPPENAARDPRTGGVLVFDRIVTGNVLEDYLRLQKECRHPHPPDDKRLCFIKTMGILD